MLMRGRQTIVPTWLLVEDLCLDDTRRQIHNNQTSPICEALVGIDVAEEFDRNAHLQAQLVAQ